MVVIFESSALSFITHGQNDMVIHLWRKCLRNGGIRRLRMVMRRNMRRRFNGCGVWDCVVGVTGIPVGEDVVAVDWVSVWLVVWVWRTMWLRAVVEGGLSEGVGGIMAAGLAGGGSGASAARGTQGKCRYEGSR